MRVNGLGKKTLPISSVLLVTPSSGRGEPRLSLEADCSAAPSEGVETPSNDSDSVKGGGAVGLPR